MEKHYLKHRIAAALIAISFVLPLFTGCGGSLVGRWSIEPGQSTAGVPEEMELLKDGTGIVDKMGVTWKTENGRLYFTALLGAIAADYKLSGSTLTLTTEKGSRTYKKKKTTATASENSDGVLSTPVVLPGM